jgi:hypothetical protein
MSSNATGPERTVVVAPEPGVAHANLKAIPPKAQATMAPASTTLQGLVCGAPLANSPSVFFVNMDSLLWSALQWRDIAVGAQTKRRGDAGPVRNLLDGSDLTGRFVFS